MTGNIADLFLDERARLTDRERSLMTGILRALIHEVERELRRELAERLAELPGIPAELVGTLADGDDEIARPILMRGRALRSLGLIGAVKMRCREHRLATALRPGLSAEIATTAEPAAADDIEALLRAGDKEAAALAEAYLVAEAKRVDRRQMPLLPLADLPPELVRLLFWAAAAALRVHLHRDPAVDPRGVDDAIEAATRGLLDNLPRPSAPAVDLAARALLERVAETGSLDAALLLRLLRAGHVAAFLIGLAMVGDLPDALTRRVVFQADGISLAILCRACGIERAAFVDLFGLVHRGSAGTAQLPGETRDSILAFYDRMTMDNASAALAFWRRDPDFVSAIDQVAIAVNEPPATD